MTNQTLNDNLVFLVWLKWDYFIKNEISKLANLRSDKFRNFIVGNIDEIKINGMIIK